MFKSIQLLSIILFCSLFAKGQNIIHSEILGRPTNNGISVKAIFDSTVQARISYGTATGVYPYQTFWQTFNPDTSGEAVALISLTGLTSNTKYYYKLQYMCPSCTTIVNRLEHTFHTARDTGTTFTFTIEADPHLDVNSDTGLFRQCLSNQLDDSADFMVDLGDFTLVEKYKNSSNQVTLDTFVYRCKLLRSCYESVCHSIPLFNVLGNHEGETGWYQNGSANNIAVWGTNFRKKYFINPVPDNFYTGDTTHYNYVGQREAYFSWTWGDALFIVLDPYWFTNPKPDSLHGWRWTLGQQQYNWLKNTLQNSTSRFKFVFCHQLVGGNKDGRGGTELAEYYEWGGLNSDSTNGWSANRPGWYKPIKELLEENRVTIFFHGHDHFFAKQKLGCLIYQECPQPSLPNFQTPQNAANYGYVHGTIIPNSGHLRVNVSPAGVSVDYIRAVLPSQVTPLLHNKDTSYTYSIGAVNCYDSLTNVKNPKIGNINLESDIFPNPFSLMTSIKYSISKANNVEVKVYDILGKEIATIINQYQSPGNHIIDLNPENYNLKNGIYYCRIITGNYSVVKKMICLK